MGLRLGQIGHRRLDLWLKAKNMKSCDYLYYLVNYITLAQVFDILVIVDILKHIILAATFKYKQNDQIPNKIPSYNFFLQKLLTNQPNQYLQPPPSKKRNQYLIQLN